MALVPKANIVQSIAQLASIGANDDLAPVGTRVVQELTEKEAAAELRISVDLLRAERARGSIRFARSGRRVFYPVVCIEEYRQERVRRTCPATSSGAMEPSNLR